jgi:hypothetical protein
MRNLAAGTIFPADCIGSSRFKMAWPQGPPLRCGRCRGAHSPVLPALWDRRRREWVLLDEDEEYEQCLPSDMSHETKTAP